MIALSSTLIKTGNSLKAGIGDSTPAMAWEIKGPNSTLYLIGTIHVLKPTLLPLPEVFDQMFASSDHILFETNPLLQTDPQRQVSVSKLILAEPEEVKAAFSRAERKALKKFAKQQGIPYDGIFTVVPMFGAMQISQLRTSAIGYAFNTGVEMHYARQASTLGKRISELEPPEAPIHAMVDYPLSVQTKAMMGTINQMSEVQLTIEAILRGWLEGDAESVYAQTVEEMKIDDDFASFATRLLDDRNVAWLPVIQNALKNEATTVVMVGAAHMGGPKGLLALLRAEGYNPVQLSRDGSPLVEGEGTIQ